MQSRQMADNEGFVPAGSGSLIPKSTVLVATSCNIWSSGVSSPTE
jgi:hypothetical protein